MTAHPSHLCAALCILVGACQSSPSPTPRKQPALAKTVDAGRYESDLRFIAEPRPPGSPHWQAVQDRCFEVFDNAGLETERQEREGVVNVLGRKQGTSLPSELVIVSAHYDSVPGCSGADDNASGVAALLEIARAVGGTTHARTLLLACWDDEETGMNGSRAFVSGLSKETTIAAHYAFEMIAFASSDPETQALPPGFDALFPQQTGAIARNEYRGDFIAVVADSASASAAERFATAAVHWGLPTHTLAVPDKLRSSPLLSDLRRSDHAPFWAAGLPSIMLTDTADFRNPYYHCAAGEDSVNKLDLPFALRVTRAALEAALAVADER
jgi:hypothetical protein